MRSREDRHAASFVESLARCLFHLVLAGAGALLSACGDDEPTAAREIGEPTQLAFAVQPSDADGQEPIGPAVKVEVRDRRGMPVTGSSLAVTVSLAVDPTGGEATLSGRTTVRTAGGVATFTDVTVDLPARGYELEAEASGLPPVTSEPFAVRLTFAQISAGGRHTCGVTVADHAYCWGGNLDGQLGDGTTTNRLSPRPVAGGLSLARVSAGGFHTCAVTASPSAEPHCWGRNSSGQLGDGSTVDRSTKVPVATTELFEQVSAGAGHTCGVTAVGDAYCWGANVDGQLGNAQTRDTSSPVRVVQ